MESFARLLIAIPLVSYVLAVLSLWVGLQINSFIFPIAVCISVLWECSDKRIRGCVRWTTIVAVLVVLSVTLGLSACIYDRSFDGQWYHACTIRELVNGWNPIYSSACNPSLIDGYTVLWVEHYPRGIETIAATIVACMGNLDAGKVLNLWFVFSSIVYIYLFLCYCLPTMNKYLRIWIALVVALNPVVINQMCTYYIDWTLYTLLVIFLINMYLFFVKGIQRALHIDLLLLFFIPTIKFNIFFWIVLWGGICFFALLRKSRYKHSFRFTAVCAVVVLSGIGVGAYNPYLTNWKEHGSPVYPLSGNGKVDIMDCQVLPAIRGKSNAEAALISVASNPSDDMLSEDIHVFGISKIDILSSVASDVRIGGFGIFFFEAILLSIVLFVCTGHIRRIRWYLSVLVGLLVSLVILPSGWWARYVAFFYLFPFVMLFYAERFGLKTRFSRGLHILILSLLSAYIFICLSGLVVKNIVYKETIDYVLEKMESSPGEAKLYTRNYSFLDKLERRSIPYKLFPDTEMKDKLDIPCPIYMNRTDFDFETDQPWILSLRPSFQLKWSDNNRYEGQDE